MATRHTATKQATNKDPRSAGAQAPKGSKGEPPSAQNPLAPPGSTPEDQAKGIVLRGSDAEGASLRGAPSAEAMNASAVPSSENAPAWWHSEQTTPPSDAANESPRPLSSEAPQAAQLASSGTKPAASRSFRRKASRLAAPAASDIESSSWSS